MTDSNGERLFFDLGRDGRSVNVDGVPPLRVLLGDITNVDVEVNDALKTLLSVGATPLATRA